MIIKNAQVVDSQNTQCVDVRITDGTITQLGENLKAIDGNTKIIDAKGFTLLPAFIDMHAHFREPGMTDKEEIATGSASAAKGGYTFVNLMANTNPICSTLEQAKWVQEKAKEIGLVDVNQVLSMTQNFDGKTLTHIENETNPIAIISEDGKGVMNSGTMAKIMKLASEKNIIVQSHAEDMEISKYDYRLAENLETARNILLASYYKTKLHMSHVSTKESMEYIISAKNKGIPVTSEVAPHHIWFWDFDYKVNPPIRQKDDVEFLIHAMKHGDVDIIATDHAPHTLADKEKGAPGISGLETAFAVCYTKLVKENHLSLNRLCDMMSRNPAKLLALNKGLIQVGYDGDVVLVDTNKTATVDSSTFLSKGKNTPFHGVTLTGEVLLTIKAGKITYQKEGVLSV